jgi:hypothetical protein
MINRNTRQNKQGYKDKKKKMHMKYLHKKEGIVEIKAGANGNCL